MPQAKEIKSRIASVSNTQKITNAMYLISSTKLKKAKEGLAKTRPYFEMQEKEIKRIFQSRHGIESRYFYPETGRKKSEVYSYLVITADKGLAGAYNFNVIKKVEAELRKHKDFKLYVVGEYGRRYFRKHNIPIEQSFLYTAQNPSLQRARDICSIMLGEYDEGKVDEIRVIYSDMESDLVSEVKMERLLPFERKPFLTPEEKKSQKDIQYKFTPSVTEVLNSVIPGYVTGFIYGALVDSFSAEQNARMNAMQNANDNAEELMQELQTEYNKVRQAAITQEITEIAAGARAQKKKKKKKLMLMQSKASQTAEA